MTLLDEDPKASENDGPAAPSIQLVAVGFKAVAPPPKVQYSFDGTTTIELDNEDAVFVLRQLDSGRWAVSPPADFRPDGSWHVNWTLAAPPKAATFNAVVAKQVRMLTMGLPNTGGGGYVYFPERMSALAKLGINAPGIGASDDVSVEPSEAQ